MSFVGSTIPRLTFLSHFCICLAVAAGAFFPWENGVFHAIWANDQSYMTSVIGALFVGSSIHLGRLAWSVDSIDPHFDPPDALSADYGHLAERLCVMAGFVGTAIGLSLQAKALAGGAASFTALATSLYTTATGGRRQR
jgi:hypothetical protein